MESLRISLCPAWSACPEVEIAADEVRIGEEGKRVVPKKEEWNLPVDLVHAGRLTRL